MIRRPPRSTLSSSSAASDVYKRQANYRSSVHECHIDGKPATTNFELMHYNRSDDTSVVRCFPLSGRTHQIRLHLQWLGFPIKNDPCYGGSVTDDGECELGSPRGEAADRFDNTTVIGDMTTQDGQGDLHSLGIWLHAYFYEASKWKFEIELPDWAVPLKDNAA
eukprot:TRINITY_DN7628_c0_g1_i3.p1 TRINITY_DN7628_c0_g1~~TRINITY_DN7628_c0_g1_i3.p1  ORF type:complete len:164 (+),score=21.71 TRINITY_DN7628_c0_g1_i3:134-625(+)